jgi:hypothetical protein
MACEAKQLMAHVKRTPPKTRSCFIRLQEGLIERFSKINRFQSTHRKSRQPKSFRGAAHRRLSENTGGVRRANGRRALPKLNIALARPSQQQVSRQQVVGCSIDSKTGGGCDRHTFATSPSTLRAVPFQRRPNLKFHHRGCRGSAGVRR